MLQFVVVVKLHANIVKLSEPEKQF
jgi:hypothetical protein